MAIIISYPTSASGIIVVLKTPTKYKEFFLTLIVKTTDFQLGLKFEQTCTVNRHVIIICRHISILVSGDLQDGNDLK